MTEPSIPLRDDDLLTTEECARWLKVSTTTLERYRMLGGDSGPPFIKGPGKRQRVTYAVGDVRAWLAKHRRQSTSDGA